MTEMFKKGDSVIIVKAAEKHKQFIGKHAVVIGLYGLGYYQLDVSDNVLFSEEALELYEELDISELLEEK